MNNTELTSYIKHYIKEDKTKSAIMLSGDWGTGKSHYIQHELIPSLQQEGMAHCVTVSLYGLNTIDEISKSIYLELKAKVLQNKSAITAAGKILCKTVIKGITSFWGIDLKASEKEMQEIYNSIDLTGKLVILEDIERSRIDILELLGYVNNLVETDGVKLLLVANENEIIKYEPIKESSTNEKVHVEPFTQSIPIPKKIYTDKTEMYLSIKEKTIGDTLQFEGDYRTAIQQIIASYNNTLLNSLAEKDGLDNICQILKKCNNYNLRTFIFACQKAVDIFEQMTDSYENYFIQCIFYGILFFSYRLKSGETICWDGGEVYSVELGDKDAPLFKFCYEYIMKQHLDLSKIPDAAKALADKYLYDEKKTHNDPDLKTLFNYYEYCEAEVIDAVNKVTEKLKNPNIISFYDYGSIAVYLVLVKDVIGCDIEPAKKCLINNLEGRGRNLKVEHIFHSVLGETSESVRAEYKDLRSQMESALKKGTQCIPDFEYLPEQANKFYTYVIKNSDQFLMHRRFAADLDMQRLAKMFAESSPKQKHDIRGAFLSVYHNVHIKHFYTEDYSSIQILLTLIRRDSESQADKIQKLQYSWFKENLADILQHME